MSNYFTDRVVQHPGRITLTPTGGSDEYDVDRAEGAVTTPGTPFNAESMNGAVDLYGLYYGTCTTSASTAAKVVTCAGFTLVTGAKIAVKFTYANTYDGQITLNVNGTGAKNIYNYSRCGWGANQMLIFVYDGTYWRLVSAPSISTLDCYPVGSYYETSDSAFNPNTAWGGTWASETITDDVVVEEGTNNNWTYRKWKSGKYEAHRYYQATGMNITSQSGGTYYGGNKTISLPSFHSSTQCINYSNTSSQGSGVYINSVDVNGSNLIIDYRAHASVTNTNCGGYLNLRGLYKTYTAPSNIYRWHRTA